MNEIQIEFMSLLDFFNNSNSKIGFCGYFFDFTFISIYFFFKNILKRYNSFQSAPVPPPEELPKYEVCKDEKLWQYVERLLPDRMIPPAPTVCNELPSGWKPQKRKYFLHWFIIHIFIIISLNNICKQFPEQYKLHIYCFI